MLIEWPQKSRKYLHIPRLITNLSPYEKSCLTPSCMLLLLGQAGQRPHTGKHLIWDILYSERARFFDGGPQRKIKEGRKNWYVFPARQHFYCSWNDDSPSTKIEKLMLWKRCKHETFWCVNEAPLLMLWSSINDNFLGCNLVRIRQSMAARCIEKLVSCSQNNKSNYRQW